MGNSQNSLMCAECTAIQIEDASLDNQRSNFQMTRLRHFSHYSRDFQVEQKYNRIKQNKPNFSLMVEIIYPEHLVEQKNEILLKSGIKNPNKKIDVSEEMIKKKFQVGNLKLNSLIKTQTIENISDECVMDNKLLSERAQSIDCFMILIDNKVNFNQLGYIIDIINKYCKSDALIFLVAAKQSPTASYIEVQQNKDSQGSDEVCANTESAQKDNFQGGAFEINEQKMTKSQMNNESNMFASFAQQDLSGSKSQTLQTQVKNIMENSWNTDFVCIDYDSVENINQKLENILSQCIYSQDSRIRSTQI